MKWPNFMDKINNGILWGFRKTLKKEDRKKVYLIPVENYQPSPEEYRRLNLFTKLMGYHLKWSHKFSCPLVFSHDHKRHGMLQKDGTIIYLVFRDKKEYLSNLDDPILKIIKKYTAHKKIINGKMKNIKPGLSHRRVNNLFGINLLNI